MFRKIMALLSIGALLLAWPGWATAQEPIEMDYTDTHWSASYWNNVDLTGPPVLTQEEDRIDHDWGVGSPEPRVRVNRFSARWTRRININVAGMYRFTVTGDDGVRLWVDGELILDEWQVQAAKTFTPEKYLTEGAHRVRLEYFENTGAAQIELDWSRIAPVQRGWWKVEYFDNMMLRGTPVYSHYEATINHEWGESSPISGIVPADQFSVRWTQSLDLPSGDYRFHLEVDDGARLWIGGNLVLDAWADQTATVYEREVFISGGPTTLQLEYYENASDAVVRLDWERVPEPDEVGPAPVPGPVVDDTDAAFTMGGAASGWQITTGGYNEQMTWTRNHAVMQPDHNWARWAPNLRAGAYEVFAYVPVREDATRHAVYWISHRDGIDLQTIDQAARGGDWVSLGTYTFTGTETDYVALFDVTSETSGTRVVLFDAIRWESR
ncbi:MAG: PA14 domain-containing protein [Anaerolineales bacterium]